MDNNEFEPSYLPQVIVDYRGNPLIEALPPIYDIDEVARLITVDPGYHEGERELDRHYRFHCVRRLFRFFQPLDVHIDIEQRISCAIRQGYIPKNPIKPDYAARLAQGAEAISGINSGLYTNYTFFPTASAFTIIGISGVGKTTALQKILSLYPQKIVHTRYNGQPLYLSQLTWAKIDCTYDGSLRGLCLSFFSYVDRVLGTNYYKKFSAEKLTVDAALPRMTQIANTHCLGLLVIDEIQHLSQAKSGGADKMLNFFVTLVNTIGIPVVLIGTTKAMPILQSEFRQARRGSAQGDLLWDRMQNDISWEIMLKAMWKHQWTRNIVPLTDSMKNLLYDESQGIIDIAVKLFIMAQTAAIGDGTETVTEPAIKEAAAAKLRLVKPMLDALRSGDPKKIMMFDDIKPIEIDDYIAVQYGKIAPSVGYSSENPPSLEQQAVLKLLGVGIQAKAAGAAVKSALKKSKTAQPLNDVVQKALKIALNVKDDDDPVVPVEDESDLRNIAVETPYENMKNTGMVADVSNEF